MKFKRILKESTYESRLESAIDFFLDENVSGEFEDKLQAFKEEDINASEFLNWAVENADLFPETLYYSPYGFTQIADNLDELKDEVSYNNFYTNEDDPDYDEDDEENEFTDYEEYSFPDYLEYIVGEEMFKNWKIKNRKIKNRR